MGLGRDGSEAKGCEDDEDKGDEEDKEEEEEEEEEEDDDEEDGGGGSGDDDDDYDGDKGPRDAADCSRGHSERDITFNPTGLMMCPPSNPAWCSAVCLVKFTKPGASATAL